MEKSIREIIEEKKALILQKKIEIEEQKKIAILKKSGLIHKEYSKDFFPTKEYPLQDNSKVATRYYKLVVEPVSDEDYLELCVLNDQLSQLNPEVDNGKEIEKGPNIEQDHMPNSISIFLKIIASIIFIFGIIVGIIFAIITSDETGIVFMLAIWFGSFVAGAQFLALGEIISLLQRMKLK
jgi:hypothetical protein